MNIQKKQANVQSRGDGGFTSPCIGLTSNALPEADSQIHGYGLQTGVSTRNALNVGAVQPSIGTKQKDLQSWYVLRCAYGREKIAYEYLSCNGMEAFYPTITHDINIKGETKSTEESRIPNIFFAHGTFDELKEYVYDNAHSETKYLRFYYSQIEGGSRQPLIVPERQMKTLKLICQAEVEDIMLTPISIEKFRKGQRVIVTQGPFADAEGIVARFKGQQRVGIVIQGVLTVATSYIPSAFLQIIE